MSISILNRGASGGLKPELTVTAPSGSTIDLLQNGIIVATYTLGASETEHTFIVKVGTYTVRGTLGADTKSVDVTIDTVGQYAAKIEYKLWLYRAGDECEDVTGGWNLQTNAYYGAQGTNSSTKTADHLAISVARNSSSSHSYIGGFGTNNLINRGTYTKLCFDFTLPSANNNYYGVVGMNATTVASYGAEGYGGPYKRTEKKLYTERTVLEFDISSMTASGYVYAVGHVVGEWSNVTFNVYNLWLE